MTRRRRKRWGQGEREEERGRDRDRHRGGLSLGLQTTVLFQSWSRVHRAGGASVLLSGSSSARGSAVHPMLLWLHGSRRCTTIKKKLGLAI